MNNGGVNLVLVCGVPRSGTTMLANFIQRKFGIPTSPETHFFDMAFKRTGHFDMEALPAETKSDPNLVKAYQALHYPKRNINSFRALLTNILGSHPVVAEKTPDHLAILGELLEKDEKILAVVIIRRCDDVCASLMRMDWNQRSWQRNGSYWRMRYLMTRDIKRLFPYRVVVLNYESFCRDTSRGAEAIRKCLPCFRPQYLEANLFDSEVAPWKAGSSETPKARPLRHSNLSVRARMTLWLIDRVTRLTTPIPFDG